MTTDYERAKSLFANTQVSVATPQQHIQTHTTPSLSLLGKSVQEGDGRGRETDS